MRKPKMIRLAIWVLTFALSVFLLLIIPDNYSRSVWVALIFDIVAFVSQIILWHSLFERADKKEMFYQYPIVMVSMMYMAIEFLICIITALMGTSISFRLALLINFTVLVIAWIILLVIILSKDHVGRIQSRQKDHHVKI